MKSIISFFVLLALPFVGFAQYAEYEWEERDTWMNTDYIFDMAGIETGSFVADIGCHEGYLSIKLANRVEAKGRVFAVDVREDRLEALKFHLEERDLTNVNVILGDYDDPKLPKGALDVVIIMDAYHEITDYMTILEHVKTALKPGGRIVIVEKQKQNVRNQSRASQTDAHSMAPRYVRKELMSAGFKQIVQKSKLGFWEKDCEKIIWMVVATKPEL